MDMFECLERNESLVELSLANTGMSDTAAAVLARALGRIQLLLVHEWFSRFRKPAWRSCRGRIAVILDFNYFAPHFLQIVN